MPANAPRETAEILQFPVGGRASLMPKRTGFAGRDRFAEMPQIDINSWYHDDAIREDAEQVRKN